MICKYCNYKVFFEAGFTCNDVEEFAHLECLQMSGEDGGAIAEMSDWAEISEEVDFIMRSLGY